MELELDLAKVDLFERRMGDFGPWMYDYRLGDRRKHEFSLFQYAHVNPNYVAYVCRK